MVKLSIVTVCFNSASTIGKTFASVRGQTFSDFEYVVVDGGSTDGTVELCELNGDIIDILISEGDGGIYDAMNKGVSASSGNLIGILNSDDVFLDNSVLEKMVEQASIYPGTVLLSDVIINFGRGFSRLYSAETFEATDLRRGLMPAHSGAFVPRAVYQVVGGYDTSFTIAADFDFFVRAFVRHKIFFKSVPIMSVLMAGGGVSNNGFRSFLINSKEISRSLVSNGYPVSSWVIYCRIVNKLLQFIRYLLGK